MDTLLIRRRLFDMVDHQDVCWRFRRIELQPNLLLNGREKVRRRIRSVRRGRNDCAPTAKLRVVRCPIQCEIEPSCKARLVQHRTVQHRALQELRKVAYICITNIDLARPLPEYSRNPLRIALVSGQLFTTLRRREHIH
jgi:hypothetical protein